MLSKIELLKERTNLRTLLIALGMLSFGISFLYFSALRDFWIGYEPLQVVVRELGGLFIVIGTIAFLWELFVKRAFLDEVLAKTQVSNDVKVAGLIRVSDSFYHGVDWEMLFRNVKKLDIFFAYGYTWRHAHAEELRRVAEREDAQIRVVLPDPEDEQTVTELAKRFNRTSEGIKESIRESEIYFQKLKSPKGAKIDIWFMPVAPYYTFYRFNGIIIFTTYGHLSTPGRVPTFVVEKGGTLYSYFRKEFEGMVCEGGLANKSSIVKKE